MGERRAASNRARRRWTGRGRGRSCPGWKPSAAGDGHGRDGRRVVAWHDLAGQVSRGGLGIQAGLEGRLPGGGEAAPQVIPKSQRLPFAGGLDHRVDLHPEAQLLGPHLEDRIRIADLDGQAVDRFQAGRRLLPVQPAYRHPGDHLPGREEAGRSPVARQLQPGQPGGAQEEQQRGQAEERAEGMGFHRCDLVSDGPS